MTPHDTGRPAAANTLVPFGSLPGARFAEGEPDIRRWEVRAADGARVGVVEELLVDPASSEIAALAVAADPAGGAGGGLVVLPLAAARVDDRSGAVLADLTREQFAALPRGGGAAAPAQAPRAAGAGAASGPQPLAGHSGVTVERTADGEEIVRVPVIEEELVVERRPVVKEMIVIRKRAVQQEQVVEADLRRERVQVDRRDAEG